MSAEVSMDSDGMEHKMDNSVGNYQSAYEIYEGQMTECQNQIKILKDKIDDIRQKQFHFIRKYFKDNEYYNSLESQTAVTRLESHSNSRSEAGNNESNNNKDKDKDSNNNNNNANSNENNNENNEKAQRTVLSRQDAEEKFRRELSMKLMRRLNGHGNKVYAIDWHQNNRELISAARDAKCMIWNVETGFRKTAFNLDTEFTMDCKFSPNCNIVACGGLDDTCSIYRITDDMHGFKDIAPNAKLQEHGGYISSIAFVDDNRVLTASGDQTLILWDIKEANVIDIYGSHWADVMSVSVKPDNSNIFVSGSTDYTCRVWDIREKNNSNPRKISQEIEKNNLNNKSNPGKPINPINSNNSMDKPNTNNNLSNSWQLTHSAQFDSEIRHRNLDPNPCITHIYSMNSETDVNYVKWFPNGYCFAAGNEDGCIKLYDIRSNHCLNEFSFQESLGYVNPMHTESVSNPNVHTQYRNLLDKPQMYGLFNNGQTSTAEDDSRDRLKKGSNVDNTTELSHLQDMIEKYETDYEGVACLDFSKSGQFLFASYNGTSAILVWDVITGKIVSRMQEHNFHIPKVCMSPDGELLAASCWDKTNYIYQRKN